MPRTTIDIDAPVLEELKRIQEKEGTSLSAVAGSLLTEALAARKTPAAPRRFRWNTRSMQPRVSIDDKEAVQAILDEPNEPTRGA